MRSMTDEGCRRCLGCLGAKKKRRVQPTAALTPLIRAPAAPTFSLKGRRALDPLAEMFRQLQPLFLIVAAAFAIEARRAFRQRLIDQPRHRLAVL